MYIQYMYTYYSTVYIYGVQRPVTIASELNIYSLVAYFIQYCKTTIVELTNILVHNGGN